MSTVRLRPNFEVPLRLPKEEAIERIRTGLEATVPAGRWMSKGRWAELHVPPSDQRVWSPHLSIRLDGSADGCTLFGRFAPRAEVWTFFVFLYFGVAFLVVFGGIFGYVQWASDEPAWGLWSVWIGVPVLALLHLASAVGQRLGQEQMIELRSELDSVLEAGELHG